MSNNDKLVYYFGTFTKDKTEVGMNQLFKKMAVMAVLLCILVFSIVSTNAEGEISRNIRVGLYFTDPDIRVNTAVTSFNVNADKGLQVGFLKDNKFTVLFQEFTSGIITIRKDTYYVNTNGKLTEYDPSGQILPEGDKIGPYHVQIGKSYKNLDSAIDEIKSIKKKGIEAYPVFADSWQVWTGFYTESNSAEKDIDDRIKKELGKGTYNIIEPSANRVVVLSNKGEIALMFDSSSVFLQVRPSPENDPYIIKVNGTAYRGDIEVRRLGQSDMTVINILPLEHYLYGVVPGEIEAVSHPEALKAQAVAARTYTLNNIGKHEKHGFDLCNTTSCQVYKGFSAEMPSTNMAVDETKGKRVTYNGKLARVFYFSSSGGRTEDVENVWGTPIPYLRSVEDKYESGKSWNYNWESTYTAAKIKETMLARNYDLGDIVSIKISKVAPSGRVTELVIKGTKGERVYTRSGTRSVLGLLQSQWYRIFTDADVSVRGNGEENTKTQLGGSKVITAGGVKTLNADGNYLTVLGGKSRKKNVPVTPQVYTFKGKGWGHAVGMSQEGAKGMANAGFKYDEILMHYFQGTKVE